MGSTRTSAGPDQEILIPLGKLVFPFLRITAKQTRGPIDLNISRGKGKCGLVIPSKKDSSALL